jgi:hypothetical protein
MNFKLNRKGSFPLVNSGEFQCLAVGAEKVDYKVELSGTLNGLDDKGFVVDHNELDKLIQEKAKTLPALSCELICTIMVNELSLFVKSLTHNKSIWSRVTFTIIGPQSSFELTDIF